MSDLISRQQPVARDTNVLSNDNISRQAAIDALWKALYEYEDRTEKQFQESDELDVVEWIGHRIFVQNMSDIDRQAILELPSAQPEIIRCKDCAKCQADDVYHDYWCDGRKVWRDHFCGYAERRTDG